MKIRRDYFLRKLHVLQKLTTTISKLLAKEITPKLLNTRPRWLRNHLPQSWINTKQEGLMTSVYSAVSFVGKEVNHFKQFNSPQVCLTVQWSTFNIINDFHIITHSWRIYITVHVVKLLVTRAQQMTRNILFKVTFLENNRTKLLCIFSLESNKIKRRCIFI